LSDRPRQKYVRKKEGKIMEVISAHHDKGIAHLKLASIVKIDRKNLTPYMKRLRRKGLVKREKGKQGKYYPTTKGNRGASITADIFSKAAAGMILANKDFPMDSPFLRNIVTDKPFEYALVMFSNKIGSIITYFLIQSMNPANKIMGNDTKNDGAPFFCCYQMNFAGFDYNRCFQRFALVNSMAIKNLYKKDINKI
jgi:predicted transcriptional regulator